MASIDPALSARDIRTIMIGLMLALLLAALDSTIVGPAMSTIGKDLKDYDKLPWVVTAYLLVSTTLTPLYGKLSDIRGRRVMLLAAIACFVAGSIACALAPSMLALALARGFQGVGGAGIMAMTMTIIGDIVPVRDRPRYQVYTAVVWVVANLAGPVVGGDLAAWSTWRMIFWINAPLGTAAWLVASSRLRRIPRHERPHRLDYPGALLLIGATTSTLLCLNGVGQPGAAAPELWLAALLAVLLWGLLVWRQGTAAEPLIPLTVLSNKVVLSGILANGFAMAAYLGMAIYIPIFFQTTLGLSVAGAGAAALPLMVGSTLSAGVAARLMVRLRRYWLIPRIGLLVAAAGALALSAVRPTTPLLAVETLTLVVSIGAGPLFPIINVSIQAATPHHELGTAMSLVTFMRNLGAALGVAILGALIVGGAAGGVVAASSVVSAANASARFHWAFIVVAAAFAAASLCLSLTREPSILEGAPVEPLPAFE